MTYVSGGLIQATDYNNFVSTGSPNLNSIWSTGSGPTGYGQSAVSTVAPYTKVLASQFAQLINTISTMAAHQGTSISPVTAPVAGQKIVAIVPQIQNNLSAISASPLNASVQGSSFIPAGGSATNTTFWSNQLQFTYTVSFSSQNALRYYFNSGGQIQFTLSSTAAGDPVNAYLSLLCSDLGTILHSSNGSQEQIIIAGMPYFGVTKIGTGGQWDIFEVAGFYRLFDDPNSTYNLITQYDNTTTYSASQIKITARYDGNNSLIYNIAIDINDATGGFTVTSQTTSTLTLKPPSTTYLSNTWGTPTVTSSISAN